MKFLKHLLPMVLVIALLVGGTMNAKQFDENQYNSYTEVFK